MSDFNFDLADLLVVNAAQRMHMATIARGEEREIIVRFLRDLAADAEDETYASAYTGAANLIEKGEHLK